MSESFWLAFPFTKSKHKRIRHSSRPRLVLPSAYTLRSNLISTSLSRMNMDINLRCKGAFLAICRFDSQQGGNLITGLNYSINLSNSHPKSRQDETCLIVCVFVRCCVSCARRYQYHIFVFFLTVPQPQLHHLRMRLMLAKRSVSHNALHYFNSSLHCNPVLRSHLLTCTLRSKTSASKEKK